MNERKTEVKQSIKLSSRQETYDYILHIRV